MEERKVKALESIAFGLDRLTSVVERVEEEVQAQVDQEALRAFKEARFPLGEWDRRERFADWIMNASEIGSRISWREGMWRGNCN